MRNRNTPTRVNLPLATMPATSPKKRAVMENALLVFASATPLTETYHAAQSGKLKLVTLTQRYGGCPLPSVDFIDMRAELTAGNPREVSRRLARGAAGESR